MNWKAIVKKYGIEGKKIAAAIGISHGQYYKKISDKPDYTHKFSVEEEKKIEKFLKELQKDISAAL